MSTTERIPGTVSNVKPFRIGRDWFIRASVNIAGLVVVNNVLASSGGVAWPMSHGEDAVMVTDPDLLSRAEETLRRIARETAESMRQKPDGGSTHA